MVRPSEAVPETVVVPERVAPLAGVVMETEGAAGETTLIERFAEAECAAASFTCTAKENVPATVGVPLIVPLGDKVVPVGNVPLASDHVYGDVPPLAARFWRYAAD